MRWLWRLIKWSVTAAVLLVVVSALPIAYIEAACRQDPVQTGYKPVITDTTYQRAEANSYLTYPEWHIVYAYEGLAKVLETGDEHGFGYISSVHDFWSAFCDLNRKANEHGGGDFETRVTVHTIGVSFTLEMILKGLYEESVGRLFAMVRGPEKSPQDVYAVEMAADYARFLQQVPWYKYDFDKAVAELWSRPLADNVRGWERRLALGGEWKAKAGYAKVIAGAVAASGEAQVRIRTVVEGLTPEVLSGMAEVDIVSAAADQVIIETPRYRKFTRILQEIAAAGGQVSEIAGNDDIMLSIIVVPGSGPAKLKHGTVISTVGRDGYADKRVLVGVKVKELTPLLRELQTNDQALEHVYDY